MDIFQFQFKSCNNNWNAAWRPTRDFARGNKSPSYFDYRGRPVGTELTLPFIATTTLSLGSTQTLSTEYELSSTTKAAGA
jgi:hypothetical protein